MQGSLSEHTVYPYPTNYEVGDQQIDFTYEFRVGDKLVFKARTASRDVIMKFTRKYSTEAHRLLAGLGYAPMLHAVNALPGGWNMVVMDF